MAHDVGSRTPPRPGSEFAGYRIEALVGRGGMGVVYLARDERLGRSVALKLLKPELAAGERFRERFLRESRLAASLDHSHVVPIYEAGETDGQLYISMRYVQGDDLKTLLDRGGSLDHERAVELCAQVGEALDAAHAVGLVHRDVKPANVLVTNEGGNEHCYLVDFGLALGGTGEPLSEETLHLSGTPDYLSPEQIGGKPSGPLADVYSLGCVLYECLTGMPPFPRDRPMATLFAHLSDPPPSPHASRRELPEATDAVVTTALAKDPEERYQSCAALIDAARDALGLTEKRLSRRRLLLAGGSAALAVAAAATVPVVLLTRGSRAAPGGILPLKGDSLVRIDPASGEPTAAVPAPNASWVGVSDGSVWYADTDAKLLWRVDPEHNRAVASFDLSPIPRLDVFEAGANEIWIAKGPWNPYFDAIAGARVLWRFDTRTHSIETISREDAVTLTDVAAGPGGLWAAALGRTADEGKDAFLRVDEGTARVGAVVPGGTWNVVLTTDRNSIWVLSPWALRRIDPSRNTVVSERPVDFGGLPEPERERGDDLVVAAGALWLMNVEDESVLRIDPAVGRVVDRVPVGRVPTALAFGAGALWAASGRDATVTRIDPETRRAETIPVGGSASSVAAGAQGVWVVVSVGGRRRVAAASGEGPLKQGLATGMYGGPTGFPGAERYQYPLDSAEGRAISALRRMTRDGAAPDLLVVNVFDAGVSSLTTPFSQGAPTIARLFEEETGIKLRLVPTQFFAELGTNLRNAKRKRFTPDVVSMQNLTLGTLAEAGLLRPLDDLVAKHDPQWVDSVYGYAGGERAVVMLTRYRDAIYAVPTDIDTQPYFYRGDLLDDARERAEFADRYGRELRFPRTWDEHADVAEFFTRPNADPPLFGDVSTLFPFWGSPNWYQRFVCSAAPNLPYFDADGSANVAGEEGVRAFEELLRSLAWHPPKAPEKDFFEQFRLMGAGSGFGGGSYPNLTKNVVGSHAFDHGVGKWIRSDVMPGRIADGGLVRRPVTHITLQHGVNRFADRANQEAAYLFLQWLSGPRIHTWFVINPAGLGYDPLRTYSLEDPYVARAFRPQPTAQLKNIIPRTAAAISLDRGWEYQDALGQTLWDVLNRKRTPEQGAKRLAEKWNRITEKAGVEKQVEALKTFSQGFPTMVDAPDQEFPVQEVSTVVA